MNILNYTPLDLNKLRKPPKGSNVNFYLLIVVTVIAAIFSVLLFIYIQKKNEKLNQLSEPPTQTTVVIEPTDFPTPTIKINTNRIIETTSEAKIASGESKPTATPSPTIDIKKASGEAKTSTSSAN